MKPRTFTDSVRASPLPGCLHIPTRPGLLIRAAQGTSLYITRASDLDDLNIEHDVVISILGHDRNPVGDGRGRDPAVVDRHLPACRAQPRYQQRPGLGDRLIQEWIALGERDAIHS